MSAPTTITETLKTAIDDNDVEGVVRLMTASPDLHGTPITSDGYLPLTYVARCHASRLELAEWMLTNGSDVHQDGERPLTAVSRDRLPVFKLLVAHGANLDMRVGGSFPLLFYPIEDLDPVGLQIMLDHGANPNCPRPDGGEPYTALDYACATYVRRQPDLTACINLILAAGGTTQYDVPVVMDLLRHRIDAVAERLAADPSLVSARFPQLTFGATGGRNMWVRGGTLLHVAAEYQNLEAATLLLDRGADVNARATVDDGGVGGQTPIFHSATQFSDNGLPVTRLLVARGADLSVRAKVAGHYERPDEIVDCTPLGFALHLEEVTQKPKTIAFLREQGGAI